MKFLPQWLRQNFRIKFGLFVLATLLWFLVVAERNYEYAYDVPIQIDHLRRNKIITEPIPITAEVKFQARGRQLLQMQFFSKPFLRLNLSSTEMHYIIRPSPEMVMIPRGLEVIALEVLKPDSIPITLDEKMTITVPVNHRISAEPAAGYIIASEIQLTPSIVQVSGPQSRMAKVKNIGSVDIEMLDLRRNTTIVLDLISPYDYGVKIIPSTVRALVRVERLGEQLMTGVPVRAINAPSDRVIVLDPATVNVKVTGAVSVLTNMENDDLKVWVDFHELNQKPNGGMTVHFESSKRIESGLPVPSQVKLTIRRNSLDYNSRNPSPPASVGGE
ncbi:MAG: CdaR family protein [Candidatus Electryoneaceae bacterium]|nr:CdaR family protein [Candidatus Electryoneaceae bacterium]